MSMTGAPRSGGRSAAQGMYATQGSVALTPERGVRRPPEQRRRPFDDSERSSPGAGRRQPRSDGPRRPSDEGPRRPSAGRPEPAAGAGVKAAAGGKAAPWLRVAPPLPVMVPRAPFIAMILVLVVGGVMGILVLNTKINENAFRLHDLQQRQATLDQRQQDLEQRLADYEAPNSLAAAACKLGLVSAGAPAFIRLPDGKVIGMPQPASGDPCVSSRQAGGTGR